MGLFAVRRGAVEQGVGHVGAREKLSGRLQLLPFRLVGGQRDRAGAAIRQVHSALGGHACDKGVVQAQAPHGEVQQRMPFAGFNERRQDAGRRLRGSHPNRPFVDNLDGGAPVRKFFGDRAAHHACADDDDVRGSRHGSFSLHFARGFGMKSKSLPLLAAVLAFGVLGDLAAQSKPIPAPAEYGQFESLQASPGNSGLSPDGRWIAYGVNRSNRNNELRIAKVADGSTTAVPFGSKPAFSTDWQWAPYAIGLSESQEDKLRSDKKPIPRKAGILDLPRGPKAIVDDIESFAFNASGSHLAMRRYAPEPDKKPGADSVASDSEGPLGSPLIVRSLASARDTTFGN